jgi:hypothetical protein
MFIRICMCFIFYFIFFLHFLPQTIVGSASKAQPRSTVVLGQQEESDNGLRVLYGRSCQGNNDVTTPRLDPKYDPKGL